MAKVVQQQQVVESVHNVDWQQQQQQQQQGR